MPSERKGARLLAWCWQRCAFRWTCSSSVFPRLTWDVSLPFYQRLCISFPWATSSQEDQCPSRDLPPMLWSAAICWDNRLCYKGNALMWFSLLCMDSQVIDSHLHVERASLNPCCPWCHLCHKSWCRGAVIKLDCDMKESRSDSIMWVAKKKQGKSDVWCLDDQSVCMEIVCFQALFHEDHVGGSCPLLILKFYHQYLPQYWIMVKILLNARILLNRTCE